MPKETYVFQYVQTYAADFAWSDRHLPFVHPAAQWLGPLAGIIMASILLCVYQKGCYTIAAVIFAVGGIFDIVAMMTW